ncbi:hypothetical protein KR067_003982, partial [Drosophila pandora]
LGSGAAGEVRRACWRGQEIAVKLFDYFNKFAEREITHLARLKHKNIVKVYGTSKTGNDTYLLMEYVAGGSLHDFLHGKDQRKFSVEEAINLARQCAMGMAYMHSMEPKTLVHRDIKPRNMLLTNMFKDLKICDFGTATDLATYLSNMRGTPAYMAPEVYRAKQYTEKCDVYSFGIMLWEIMARKLPFSHLPNPSNGFAVLGAAERGELLGELLLSSVSNTISDTGIRPPIDDVRPDCWKGIKHLIQRCWDKDPALRPSMKKVEKYLGMLGASVNYKDFVHVLDDVSMAVVTFHMEQGPSGWRRYVRVEFWRKQIRTARLTFSMVDFNQTGKKVVRESIRALKDGKREVLRVEKQVEREASRVYEKCERETRVAADDVVRETGRATEDVMREAGR